MRTQMDFHVKENRKDIHTMPPDLALCLTFNSSNYPCLELIFMVPKVLEPLKFYCTYMHDKYTYRQSAKTIP